MKRQKKPPPQSLILAASRLSAVGRDEVRLPRYFLWVTLTSAHAFASTHFLFF
jgi:hypothetical protein